MAQSYPDASGPHSKPDVPDYQADCYHRFCAMVMALRPGTDQDEMLRVVKAFYRYVQSYPEYEKTLTRRPVIERRYPDYDYATRMTGLYGDYVRQLERKYALALEMPESELGRLLAQCQDKE